ncbi:AEC family transporter [Sporanaerobium hydrogeniformans]|uniref:AEC family transporter n=1 Tax=Sporanaerobium hydrogeniformans TaxID=3072179 RepID=UPI0027E3FCAE|nr:AEC family transporter [Sporanaerobium hydrogeniformans]
MVDILIRAMLFIIIIIIGYGLKRVGIFKKEDFSTISKIVLNLTLPCAIIVNFSNLVMEKSLMIMIVIGFLCNVILIVVGYILAIGKSNEERSFNMINLGGYNIGSFTIPFAQAFLGPVGIVAICLFDAGNAIMATGGTYAVASSLDKSNGEKMTISAILKKLMSSPPLVCYIVMLILAFLKKDLPTPVLDLVGLIGAANAFLSMFMIGIGFQLNFKKSQVIQSTKIILSRYIVAAILAVIVYNVLPFDMEIRKAIVLVVFSPISAVSTAFTEKIGGDIGLSSTINSLSIIMGLVFITSILVLI